ncbi:hypothetical protein O181_096881 [Austropuccinia psidii MF-1]|uniref:Uncharacterized protein n=1 Tax=Austropuccinia psidii MF-1 TaxID=1389203 RepID=A0A9Q3PEL0_9BASI|nr:hypothetical protein [Austropuccinia psidii MF-1]
MQTLEEMIRKFCAYELEFIDSDGFTHDWCTLIPALELEYKKLVHSSTGQAPAMLEKGWNPRLPIDTLRKDLLDIHPTASSFKIILDKVKHNTTQISLRKPYQPADKELFPLRNPTPLTLPPVEQSEDKTIKKVIKERRLRGKNQSKYLVRYKTTVHEDEWLGE